MHEKMYPARWLCIGCRQLYNYSIPEQMWLLQQPYTRISWYVHSAKKAVIWAWLLLLKRLQWDNRFVQHSKINCNIEDQPRESSLHIETKASSWCIFIDPRAPCTINCFMMNKHRNAQKIAQLKIYRQLDLKNAKLWFNITF